MSMIGILLKVNSDELELYLKDSSKFQNRIDSEQNQNGDPDEVYLDKAWDGILYLLTGTGIAEESDHPLKKVLFSEQFIDESMDLGYGPAQYLSPDQVKQLNDELSKISEDDLESRYNPEDMTAQGIYPDRWDDPEGKEFLFEYFAELKGAYASAAAKGQGIIIYLT